MVNYVISGGPGVGKSSVIAEMKKLGYNVLEEVARKIACSDERFVGKSSGEINHDEFEDAILDFQRDLFRNLGDGVCFCDSGIGDSIAYRKFHGVPAQDVLDFSKELKHDKIFVLDILNVYEQDELRKETREEQKIIHDLIIGAYRELGYEIVFVPAMSVEDRVRFILERVDCCL